MKLVRVLSADGAARFAESLRLLRDKLNWHFCFAIHADSSQRDSNNDVSGKLLEEQFLVNMQQGRCSECDCEDFQLKQGSRSTIVCGSATCAGKHAHRPYWTSDCMCFRP
jgi:hypothetical protein